MLLRAMQAENEKLIAKSAFMIRNMLVTNPTHKGIASMPLFTVNAH